MTVNSSKIESLPGRAGAFLLDLREVTDIKSKYTYSYYEPDEDSSTRFEIKKELPDITETASYMSVEFKKPSGFGTLDGNLESAILGLTLENEQSESRLDFDKIVTENDLGGNLFTGITLGLPNETGELRDLTKEASAVVINATESNSIVNQSTTDFIQSYSNSLKESGFIFSEIYKNELPRFFESISNENLGREERANTVSYLNYENTTTYFSPILTDVASDIINNSTSIFSNSVKREYNTINSIRNRSKNTLRNNSNPMSNYFPTINSSKIYDSEIILNNFISENQFSIKDQLYNDIAYVGVVVKVKITLKNGNVVTIDPKIIIDPDCEKIYISNPPYGSSVGVKISSLYALKIPVYSLDSGELFKTTGVIFAAGKGISSISAAIDTTPPPPPQDLSFNLTNLGLEINWSLPFNTQRDIAKFRVFKRKNKNEPFELLKQISFGGIRDRNIPENLNELPVNVEGNPVMKTHCIDRSFDEDTVSIYAVTCIDVHDLTSNYSEQIKVKVNPVFNRLETSLFGRIGAYIQYPNMTMEKEVFEGVVKASGYNRAKIYFNPDFLRVYRSQENGQEKNLLNIDSTEDNLFKLNLINIDLQEQQNLDIIIGEKIVIPEFDSNDSAIVKSFLDEDTSLS